MKQNNPWSKIQPPKESSNFNGFLASKDSLFEFYWAIDNYNNNLLVLNIENELFIPSAPNLNGIEIIIGKKIIETSKKQIIFKLLSKKNIDIFFILCSDLISCTENHLFKKDAIEILFQRLKTWQLFLKNNNKILDKRELIGLLGELYFMYNYSFKFFSIEQSLNFWKAPLKTSFQDYEIDTLSIEVKTLSNNKITISSFEQLNKSVGDLFLYCIEINESINKNNDAITIFDMIESIRKSIEINNLTLVNKFDTLLINYGFFPIDDYKNLYFIIKKDYFYRVFKNFPKIDKKPNGIEGLTYKINLDYCNEYITSPEYFYKLWSEYGY